MHDQSLDARLEAGVAITREAGQLALGYFAKRRELAVETKGLQDLVSIADREVERLIRERLTAQFPNDGLLGEEEGGSETDNVWIIDPIDGTANFLRGLPYWCVTIAYAVQGRTEIAVTYDALHDEMFSAQQGKGAKLDGRAINVSGRTAPSKSCIGFAHSFKLPAERFLDLQAGLLRHQVDMRRLGSSALLLAHVADGRLDAAITPRAYAWDVLAGLLLVKEAGGDSTIYTDGCSLTEPRAVFGATPGLVEIAKTLAEAAGA